MANTVRPAIAAARVVVNNGALPLAGADVGGGSVALIGRHGLDTVDMGGGSAQVNPPYQSTVAEGLTALLGEKVTVADGVAVRSRPVAADPSFLTDPATGTPGMEVVLLTADGTELSRYHSDSSTISIGWDDGLDEVPATAVLTTTLTNEAGPVLLGAIGYRGYHAGAAPEPLFWFGHGLGYGTWEQLTPGGELVVARGLGDMRAQISLA